jgi:hypothetical protein
MLITTGGFIEVCNTEVDETPPSLKTRISSLRSWIIRERTAAMMTKKYALAQVQRINDASNRSPDH